MKVKQLVYIITILLFSISCGSDKPDNASVSEELKTEEIIPSGKEEVKQLIDYLDSNKLTINQTTSEELSFLYKIVENDYYMTKKIELEDHVLYINFTIANGTLSKVSYATLSNTPKDFSYVGAFLTERFGPNFSLTFNTNDSLANNAIKIWKLDGFTLAYETFSDLNSGYEISVE